LISKNGKRKENQVYFSQENKRNPVEKQEMNINRYFLKEEVKWLTDIFFKNTHHH
jgi:hypothetical protein